MSAQLCGSSRDCPECTAVTGLWWGEFRVISTHAVEIHLNIMKKRCNGVGAWSGGPHPMVG